MTDPHCLFCKIISGAIPSRCVYNDDRVFAFEDIHPQAPVHVLVIPKVHIPSMAEVTPEQGTLMGELLLAAQRIAEARPLPGGYRLVVNCGQDAGQAVEHLHVHLLGGRSLVWPPG